MLLNRKLAVLFVTIWDHFYLYNASSGPKQDESNSFQSRILVTPHFGIEKYFNVSCADKRWSLQDLSAIPYLKNKHIQIWTIENVYLTVSASNHVVRVLIPPIPSHGVDSTSILNYLQKSSQKCNGKYGARVGLPVFFNCPCDLDPQFEYIFNNTDKFCPGNLEFKFLDPIKSLRRLTQAKQTKEVSHGLSSKAGTSYHDRVGSKTRVAIVFNTWASKSRYHGIMDALFSLWVTVDKIRNGLHYGSNTLFTLVNISPGCPSDPHLHSFKPLSDVLFGPLAYENSLGTISHSFGKDNPTFYNLFVYGFAYPFSISNHIGYFGRETIPEIGNLFRRFTLELKRLLLNTTSSSTTNAIPNTIDGSLLHAVSTRHSPPSIVFIDRPPSSKADDRLISNYDNFINEFNALNVKFEIVNFGSGALESYQSQAQFSSKVEVLMGAEGAGFIQQLFMPQQSILIILHGPRFVGGDTSRWTNVSIDTNRWHERPAHYLGHNILNLAYSKPLENLVHDKIAVKNIINNSIDFINKITKAKREKKQPLVLVEDIKVAS